MTRKFLTGLGIETETVDKIMEVAGADIEREKANITSLNDEITKLRQDVADSQKEFSDYKATQEAKAGEDEPFKAKYETEVAAHGETKKTLQKTYDDFVQSIETEKTAAQVRKAVIQLLKEKGANPIALDKEMFQTMLNAQVDTTKAKIKEGKVENVEELAAPFMTGLDFLFGKTETKSAVNPANPPANNSTEDSPKSLGEALQAKYTKK